MEEVDLKDATEFLLVIVYQGVSAIDDVLIARETMGRSEGDFFQMVDVDDTVVTRVVGV